MNLVASRSAARHGVANDADTASPLFVNSVEKAFRVLAAFGKAQTQLSLSMIAARTGLDLSAAQRFTHTLTALGYLAKDPITKTYTPAVKLLDFSFNYVASNEIVRRATPFLHQLSQDTEEACNITLLDGTDIIFALRIISQHAANYHVITGTRLPAYCTAPGLAILSRLPAAETEAILANSQLIQHTKFTVVEPARIRTRLKRFSELGYSHTEDEYYIGDISTAAPILDKTGRPVAAINVAVSRPRWQGREHEQRMADLVIAAANAISS